MSARGFMLKAFFGILILLQLSGHAFAIESLDGFLVSAYDDRFKVVSPEKFKPTMEVVIENKTLVRLVGKLTINKSTNASFLSVESGKFQKANVKLKKGDVLHFVPLSPSFQEVELIVGNKNYDIPPQK